MKSSDVFTGGLALLAFVMALYGLAAREQKTPYITNSVYSTALFVLTAILFSAIGEILQTRNPHLAIFLVWVSRILLGIGILNVFYKVWQIQNRKINFRNDNLLKNLKIVRQIKKMWRALRARPTYEHNPISLQKPLLECIGQCSSLPKDQLEKAVERGYSTEGFALSLSATYRISNLSQADDLLTELACCFLKHDCWIQYTTCTRHPIEFLLQLKKKSQASLESKDWQQVVGLIISVDAYSPHFGFTDSIHEEATKSLKKQGIECVTAKASYAGLHTAAAQAFNKIKSRSRSRGQQTRLPTLVIYECPYALIELESTEQYRIFVRHLIPSERLWGGMFTVVVESTINEQDLALLQMYTDLFIDMTSNTRCDSDAS